MDEDSAGDAAAACGPGGVLDRDVIRDDDLVDDDILVGGHVGSHLEVHNVTGVVFDDQEGAFAALCRLDGLIDLVGCGGGEYCACYCGIQHAFADIAAVGGLMSAAAAADQDDFVCLFGACAGDDICARYALDILRKCCCHAVEHLIDYIVDTIDQFFHFFPP